MANITLGTLRDYWKRVYDAITGPPGTAAPGYAMQVGGSDGTNLRTLKTDASGNLSVLLNGRKVSVVPIRSTPLGAGQFYTSPWVDLTQNPDIAGIGFAFFSDRPILVALYACDQNDNRKATLFYGCMRPSRLIICPPVRPMGKKIHWLLSNTGAVSETILEFSEIRTSDTPTHPQNIPVVLAHDIAIRDTNSHTHVTDPGYMWPLTRIALGGGKLPIYCQNGHDQAINVTITQAVAAYIDAILGTKSIPAGATYPITNADFPGLDVPSETLYISLKANVAPTTGTFRAAVDLLAGGAA